MTGRLYRGTTSAPPSRLCARGIGHLQFRRTHRWCWPARCAADAQNDGRLRRRVERRTGDIGRSLGASLNLSAGPSTVNGPRGSGRPMSVVRDPRCEANRSWAECRRAETNSNYGRRVRFGRSLRKVLPLRCLTSVQVGTSNGTWRVRLSFEALPDPPVISGTRCSCPPCVPMFPELSLSRSAGRPRSGSRAGPRARRSPPNAIRPAATVAPDAARSG
jgi:hypothetical protein